MRHGQGRDRGLCPPALSGKALDRHTFAADVDADIELGHKLGIAWVPALYLDGKSVPVPYGVDELARLLEPQ